jgi:hypothetical protein
MIFAYSLFLWIISLIKLNHACLNDYPMFNGHRVFCDNSGLEYSKFECFEGYQIKYRYNLTSIIMFTNYGLPNENIECERKYLNEMQLSNSKIFKI